MKQKCLVGILLVASLFPMFAAGSSVRARLQHHTVTIGDGPARHVVYGVFADEQLVFEVQLDVFELPEIKSSKKYPNDLKSLPVEGWTRDLEWQLLNIGAPGSQPLELGEPSVSNERAYDRTDTSVECRTYSAVVRFPELPVGSYEMRTSMGDLSSKFRFVVKTGSEPEWRDEFLHTRARNARTWDEYKRYTFQRLELDATRFDLALGLIDRSLLYGTLDETKSYVEKARSIALANGRAGVARFDSLDALDRLQELESVLETYYARRNQLDLRRDAANDGRYTLRSRSTGEILKASDLDKIDM